MLALHHGVMDQIPTHVPRGSYDHERHMDANDRHGGAPVVMAAAHPVPDTRAVGAVPAVAIAFIVLLATFAAARAQATAPADPANTAATAQAAITVTGTGVAYGTPDLAILELGVTVVGPDVRTALADADSVMSAVRDALLAAGVEQDDVRTVGLNVWRDERTNENGEVTLERYQVNHSYQVRVDDVSAVGVVLAAAVDAGANSIGGITFTIKDPEALAAEARALAMADAAATADQLAELAGVTLGRVTSIEEGGSGAIGGHPAGARFEAAALSSVESGQLAVSVTLSVTYAAE